MKKILIVEDEVNIRKLIAYDLNRSGYMVYEAKDGLEGKQLGLEEHFDLILIDWMLPHISGIELVKIFRNHEVDSFLMMLTAKAEEEDILESFDAGVDDYVTKPFSPKILLARINAHINKKQKTIRSSFLDIEVDSKKRHVMIQKELIIITKKEYELLCYFIHHANEVLSRGQILSDVWGFDYDGDTRIVDVHIFKLRSKLKDSEARIHSSRGVGYILEKKVD